MIDIEALRNRIEAQDALLEEARKLAEAAKAISVAGVSDKARAFLSKLDAKREG